MENIYEQIANEIILLDNFPAIKDQFFVCQIYDNNGNINYNCIYGINLDTLNMAGRLMEFYGDEIKTIFKSHGIHIIINTLKDVSKRIINKLIKVERINISGLQIVQNKDLLYRFADSSEYEHSQSFVVFTLAHLYNWGLLTRFELLQALDNNKIRDIKYVCRSAIYKLRSDLKKQISLWEYLSPSKGVSGQISGWQKYDELITTRKDMTSTIGTVMGAYDAFSLSGQRSLIILQTLGLNNGNLNPVINPFNRPIVQWIPIQGQFSRFQEEISNVEPNIIPYEAGILKLFNGGMAMPDSNYSEVDMVGNTDLYGVEVNTSPSSSIAYELLLTAARRSNILSRITPPFETIDIPTYELEQF